MDEVMVPRKRAFPQPVGTAFRPPNHCRMPETAVSLLEDEADGPPSWGMLVETSGNGTGTCARTNIQERTERTERDSHARTTRAHTGRALMVPGLAFDGIGNHALLRSGQLQRKARMAEPGDQR